MQFPVSLFGWVILFLLIPYTIWAIGKNFFISAFFLLIFILAGVVLSPSYFVKGGIIVIGASMALLLTHTFIDNVRNAPRRKEFALKMGFYEKEEGIFEKLYSGDKVKRLRLSLGPRSTAVEAIYANQSTLSDIEEYELRDEDKEYQELFGLKRDMTTQTWCYQNSAPTRDQTRQDWHQKVEGVSVSRPEAPKAEEIGKLTEEAVNLAERFWQFMASKKKK